MCSQTFNCSNILPKLPKIVNVTPNDETTLSKIKTKNNKTSRKNLKQNIKINPKGGKFKLKKKILCIRRKLKKKIYFFVIKNDFFLFVFVL
jgi:hypothetical protein